MFDFIVSYLYFLLDDSESILTPFFYNNIVIQNPIFVIIKYTQTIFFNFGDFFLLK